MPPAKEYKGTKTYLRIIDGNFVIKSEEGVERARPREAMNPQTKETKTVWEIEEYNWKGKISDIQIEDGRYGRTCKIDMGDAVITLPTNTKYFQNLAEKLPNVDLSKEVILHPYNLEVDGKKKIGVKVSQQGKPVESAYWKDGKRVDSFPKVDDKNKNKKGYWSMYYGEVEDYLCEKLMTVDTSEEPIEEMDAKDLPWETEESDPVF